MVSRVYGAMKLAGLDFLTLYQLNRRTLAMRNRRDCSQLVANLVITSGAMLWSWMKTICMTRREHGMGRTIKGIAHGNPFSRTAHVSCNRLSVLWRLLRPLRPTHASPAIRIMNPSPLAHASAWSLSIRITSIQSIGVGTRQPIAGPERRIGMRRVAPVEIALGSKPPVPRPLLVSIRPKPVSRVTASIRKTCRAGMSLALPLRRIISITDMKRGTVPHSSVTAPSMPSGRRPIIVRARPWSMSSLGPICALNIAALPVRSLFLTRRPATRPSA